MKLEKIPQDAMRPVSREPKFPTVKWVLFMLEKRDGKATFAEAIALSRKASAQPEKAMNAFQDAFDRGLIECHHANAGKRGRPRYEFTIAKKEGD